MVVPPANHHGGLSDLRRGARAGAKSQGDPGDRESEGYGHVAGFGVPFVTSVDTVLHHGPPLPTR
jgi:hypothetical protein